MVLGECQILSQMAVTMNSLNKAHPESIVLRKLFLSAIECGKEVHKNTPISSEPASIGELAVNVAKKTFHDLKSRTILILGAGAVAKLTVQKLIESKVEHIIIANRNAERGKHLAESINLDYVGIRQGEKLHEEMISLEESLRTKEYDKYFMITDDVINKDVWSFASDTTVLTTKDVKSFLKDKGVIE